MAFCFAAGFPPTTGVFVAARFGMPGDVDTNELLAMFEKSPGSYLSLMFFSRCRSSSKIDFFASTRFANSDGFTSFTSSSRNLCLDCVKNAGCSGAAACELTVFRPPPPDQISYISSRVFRRSSIEGLGLIIAPSESLELELSDRGLRGLDGGCSPEV